MHPTKLTSDRINLAGMSHTKLLLVVLLALGLGVLASPHLVYPFGHDQGIYSACGDVIRRGGVPIRDCFESKDQA